MNGPRLEQDPLFYRLRYARIARLLQKRSTDSRRILEKEGDEEKSPVRPLLELSPAASRAIDLSLRGLTPEQESAGIDAQHLPRDAAELVLEVSHQLDLMRWHWVGAQPPWFARWRVRRGWQLRRQRLLLAQFLDGILEPATVVLYFSCVVESGKKSDWILAILARGRDTAEGPLRRLDLEQGFEAINPKAARSWLAEYLSRLLDPPRRKPVRHTRLQLFGSRLSLLGRGLLARLGVTRLRERAEPNYRVRYNLACLCSRLAARCEDERAVELCLHEAEGQLERALQAVRGPARAALADWARKDPGLAALRDAGGQRFERIVPTTRAAEHEA